MLAVVEFTMILLVVREDMANTALLIFVSRVILLEEAIRTLDDAGKAHL